MRYPAVAIATALGLVAFAPLVAQSSEPLELTAAVKVALARHPLGQAAAAERDAAEAGERQATARLLPQVAMRESWARSDDPVFAFGTLLEQGRFSERDFDVKRLNDPAALDRFQTRVSVEQPIVAVPAWYGRAAASAATDAARAGETLTHETLALEVVRAYLGLGLARDAVQVADESHRVALADLERASALVRAGTALEADALQAQVHARSQAELLEAARGDARVAELGLASLLDGGASVGALADVPAWLAERAQHGAVATDLDAGLASRPDLAAIRHQASAASAAESAARASFLPTLGLVASEQWDRERFASDGEWSYTVGVALDWNLLAGGGDRAKLDVAASQARAAAARLEAAERAARLEIGARDAALATSRARLAAALGAADLAAEARRVVTRRYEQGLATWTELAAAESAFSAARLRELQARHGVLLAWAECEHALGRLTAALTASPADTSNATATPREEP
ncbi:MAG: TolC family protein [bacterium]